MVRVQRVYLNSGFHTYTGFHGLHTSVLHVELTQSPISAVRLDKQPQRYMTVGTTHKKNVGESALKRITPNRNPRTSFLGGNQQTPLTHSDALLPQRVTPKLYCSRTIDLPVRQPIRQIESKHCPRPTARPRIGFAEAVAFLSGQVEAS